MASSDIGGPVSGPAQIQVYGECLEKYAERHQFIGGEARPLVHHSVDAKQSCAIKVAGSIYSLQQPDSL